MTSCILVDGIIEYISSAEILFGFTYVWIYIIVLFLFCFAETNRHSFTFGWSMVGFLYCVIKHLRVQNSNSFLVLLNSMLGKSTHETFAMKLFQNLRAHPRLEKPKLSKTDFALSHFAGKACPVNHISCKLFLAFCCSD